MKKNQPKKPAKKRRLTKSRPKNGLMVSEPTVAYSTSTKIRAIGNSRGVILNNRIMEEAGISDESKIIINASSGIITIIAEKISHTDISTWEAQFKKSMKSG